MSRQTNGQPEGLVGGLTEFANDVATLAELQLKLAELDIKEAATQAVIPLALTGAVAAILLGSIPVAVAGAGLLIASAAGISFGLGLLLTALGLMVVVGIAGVVAVRRVVRSLETFRRSQEELKRNVSWVRTVLLHSGRSVPRRRW